MPSKCVTWVLCGSVCAIMVSPASAIIRRHDRADSLYLDYGQSSQFSAVGRMFLRDASGVDRWGGSATLIAENWVLTAAHVVDNDSVLDTDWSFDTGDGSRRYRAAEVILHPTWSASNLLVGDMALVRLEERVDNITPARLASSFTTNGSEVSLVGFGGTGQGLSGWEGDYDLRRRAGTNLSESGRQMFGRSELMAFDFDAPWADGGATNLESMLMYGDSGGAIMAETALGWELVGVNSFISFGNEWAGLYGQTMGATRVWDYGAWISGTIPSPGTLAVLAPMLFAARRRRA